MTTTRGCRSARASSAPNQRPIAIGREEGRWRRSRVDSSRCRVRGRLSDSGRGLRRCEGSGVGSRGGEVVRYGGWRSRRRGGGGSIQVGPAGGGVTEGIPALFFAGGRHVRIGRRSVRGAHPGGDVLGSLFVDVELNLATQRSVDCTTRQRTQPQEIVILIDASSYSTSSDAGRQPIPVSVSRQSLLRRPSTIEVRAGCPSARPAPYHSCRCLGRWRRIEGSWGSGSGCVTVDALRDCPAMFLGLRVRFG